MSNLMGVRILYKKYEKPMFDSVGGYMANTMKSCFDKFKNADNRSFTFVVDIDKNGKPLNADVMPKTNISNCFSSSMSKEIFPPPPKLKDKNKFTIYIDMKITPEK